MPILASILSNLDMYPLAHSAGSSLQRDRNSHENRDERGGGAIRGGLTLPLGQFQKAKALGNLNPFPHPRGNKEKCVGEASGRQRVFIIFVLFAIVFL